MKILIVNTSDIEGGAARAAYRLHRALLEANVNSKMLVQSKKSDDFTVIGPENKIQKVLSKVRPALDAIPIKKYKGRTKSLFSPSWLPFSNVVKRINKLDPDVVHLHWVAGGFFRFEDIAKINAPIVWSFHDNWAFTGGCHIMWECVRYQDSCGLCPRLGSKKENDLSRKIWIRKKKVLLKLPEMKVIGLSKWLAKNAKLSSLFYAHDVLCLPNPINTKTYAPFDKHQARTLLNLPQHKKLVAFGAMNATSDFNKGFNELSYALHNLPDDYELIVFGSSVPQQSQAFKQKVHFLGTLHDDVTLRVLYNAADVVVVPSRQENLSNAIMESLACGTPVVAFDIGGNPDLIDHKENGYLAKPYSPSDLAKGIEWVLQHESPDHLSRNARSKILDNFESNLVASKYIDLYREVLSKEK